MFFSLKKKVVLLGLILSAFLFVQTSFATAVIEHKEVEKANFLVLTPRLKSGASSEVRQKLNDLLSQRVNQSVADYNNVLAGYNEKAASQQAKYTFYSNYSVKFNKNDLLSLTLEGYQYTGGAHGISWRNSLTANLITGKILTLPDLFKEDASYESYLNQEINKQIAANPDWPNTIAFPGVGEETNFYLTEELLVIYYQPYEVAPYVYGFIKFYLRCDDLSNYLREDVKWALGRL